MIREAKQEDLLEVLNLYLYLHEETVPEQSEHLSVIIRSGILELRKKK